MTMRVAVTGLGVSCALGNDPLVVSAALQRGASGLVHHPPLEPLEDSMAGVANPAYRGWLRRRKDAKLLTRAARLGLACAGSALTNWDGDHRELGLFLGVGREPPDDGQAEAALVAAHRNGKLDPSLLASEGRDRYPPLLSLKTLPNMALAHISINFGVMGCNGVWAGGGSASLHALRSAFQAVASGRCRAALAGGADSLIDLGSARDRLRLGQSGAPGEAGAMILLESLDAAKNPIGLLSMGPSGFFTPMPWRPQLGDCGAAEGMMSVVMSISGLDCALGGVRFAL